LTTAWKLFQEDRTLVAHLCNRRFGIGGDGLILLEMIRNLILKWCITTQMEVKALCVNGGRCLVAFAKKLKTIGNSATFNAVDGLHHATIKDDGIVSLQMIDVLNIKKK
jgi:diaminopimelate epimerase